jgi:hypothetical protein
MAVVTIGSTMAKINQDLSRAVMNIHISACSSSGVHG